MTTTSRRATPMLLFRFSAFLAVAPSMLAGRPGSAGSPESWEARFGGRQLRLATVVGMSALVGAAVKRRM